MSDDLSNQAMEEACGHRDAESNGPDGAAGFRQGWRECRRRSHKLQREAFEAGWEACCSYSGDQGPRDELVDPEMARDRAWKAYQKKGDPK
jgi:hypothetical protein